MAAAVSKIYITQIIASFNQKIQSQLYQYNGNTLYSRKTLLLSLPFGTTIPLNYKTNGAGYLVH
jgi:ABC-2 type transport system permease protein